MKTYPLLALLVITAAISAGLTYALIRPDASSVPQDTARKPLYWYDPMVPTQHFDKPGKSPFMDMQLVPKYAGDSDDTQTIAIAAERSQSLGMRVATVRLAPLPGQVLAQGSLSWNERDRATVQTRAAGFVQKVYGHAPGDLVRAGAPLADLMIPEWAAAQSEFLAVSQLGDPPLIVAARQRLLLLGMSAEQVERVARSGKVAAVTTVRSPISGAIQSLDVRQGMSMGTGQTLASIAGLSKIWLELALPEVHAALAKPGSRASIELPAFAGDTWEGRVIAVLPQLNPENRQLRLRLELDNRQGRLRPGMSAQARLSLANQAPVLQIPSEAIIRTGVRTMVLLAEKAGRYRPQLIEVGRESAGHTEVKTGLAPGQQVVASGQFLIDSEASLANLLPTAAPPMQHQGQGRLEAISKDEITLSHEPIPSLNWPAMTMPFALVKPNLGQGLKPGETVRFSLSLGNNGQATLQSIERAQP